LARLGREEARDGLEQDALASRTGADDCVDAFMRNFNGNTPQDGGLEAQMDVVDLDHRIGTLAAEAECTSFLSKR
jgi:hypothetical protein